MTKTALFGGSFNPIHKAHIGLAQRFIDEADIDKVYFIPTNITPLKDNSDVISSLHRLNMCELAVKKYDNMLVSDVEVQRLGMSYTSDTIEYFLKNLTDTKLYLIVGADMFMTLDKWHNYQYIFDNVTVLTAPRDGCEYDDLIKKFNEYQKFSCKAYISKTPIRELSSTFIRKEIIKGKSVSDYLDSDVISYIEKFNLYR